MQLENQKRFNLDNLRLEIGRVDRKACREAILNMIASYGRLITTNWSLSHALGAKFRQFLDLKIEAEDEAAAGYTVIPVDCGMGLDFWFKFKEPKNFKVLKKYEARNFPCYLILKSTGKADQKLVNKLNRELGRYIAAYLNNRLYGYSVERYGDAEGKTTRMVFQGFFPSMREAERAASICFPEFEAREL